MWNRVFWLLLGFVLAVLCCNFLSVEWRSVVGQAADQQPIRRLFEDRNIGVPLRTPRPLEHARPGDDSFEHRHDDSEVANKLYEDVRVLCWVMTSAETLESRAQHVRNTWGKRCNILLFASDKEDKSFPTISVETASGREHLLDRTVKTFDYVHAHHFNDADWFMKADDDTYVIMENLRYFLSEQNTSEPVIFGQHFWPNRLKSYVPNGYASGGAGYVISKEALDRFGRRHTVESHKCKSGGEVEDLYFGQCMGTLGVKVGDTRDALNRSRFHCLPLSYIVEGKLPDWYFEYDAHKIWKGGEGISDYAISFHYVKGEQMYDMEQYVYHLRPYGILSGLQQLNKPVKIQKSEK